MTTVNVGATDLRVSSLCLGGNVFGWTADEATSHAVIDAFVDAGGNFINSAANYSAWAEGNVGGESEAIIGSWIRTRRARDKLVISTKQGNPYGMERGGLSANDIVRRTDAALRRLQTDYIDILCLQCDHYIPTDETLMAIDILINDGKIRYAGVSNLRAAPLREITSIARNHAWPQIVVLENHYSLLSRSKYEGNLAETCSDLGIASTPYWGLEKGFLTGKYRKSGDEDGLRAIRYKPSSYISPRSLRVLDALDRVAEECQAPTGSIALAWLKQRPMVVSVLASARNLDQLKELLPVMSLTLTQNQADLLTRASDGETAPLPGALA